MSDSANSIRLLVIDDDEKLCALMRDYLSPQGYVVVKRTTGLGGLQKALAESID